jgi:hypothetical protein
MDTLFNYITENDVLEWNGKTFTLGDQILSKADAGQLIQEAKMLKQTHLWPYMLKALQLAGNQAMYEKSVTLEDMKTGKGILLAEKILRMKVDNIAKLKN